MNFDLDDESAVEIMESTFGLSKIEQVQIDFKRYEAVVADMLKKADALTITDNKTDIQAVEMIGQAAAMVKAIENKRKEIVKAPNEFVKAVNQFARPYTDGLASVKSKLDQKHIKFKQQEEKKRLEQQRIANEAAQRLQAEINAAAAAVDETPTVVVQPVVLEQERVTRTQSGSISIRSVWAAEVTDFAALPDKYKKVDMVSINADVKAGLRNIPGVRIYEDQRTVTRAASVPTWDDNEKF